MTAELLEKRLENLDVETPDAGRVTARVLARQAPRRRRVPRFVAAPLAFLVLVALVVYFVPAADLALAETSPWNGEILRWAGLVGARDRITVVNSSAESSGYRFTLRGAYADETRTVLLMHSDPPAFPDAVSTQLTDQFARSYRSSGGSLNTLTGDMTMNFEPLVWPDFITGARITLHVTTIDLLPTRSGEQSRYVHGAWDMTATVGVDVGQHLPVPAPGDLGPAHFRFTSVVYTPATIEVDIEVTGVSSEDMHRIIPNGLKGQPALRIELVDSNGQIVGGGGQGSGGQNGERIKLFAFRNGGGGSYVLRVSYYGYGSFDRVLKIPS